MLVNLNEVLLKARKEKYAVGLFNTTDTDMLQAVIEAAEELKSPVILGTAEVLLPYGEFKLISGSILKMAREASVPVVVHYDHGLTFERCMQALQCGFSSIMFDGSAKDYETNLRETAEIVKIAHSFGASVEGEIGHVGEAVNLDNDITSMYTTPKEAVEYVQNTGVDALAIAVGTAHGVYKTRPKLDIDRIKLIHDTINEPLVLHGGSGLSDDDFKNSIAAGISKVNIFTDLCLAGKNGVTKALEDNLDYLEMRNLKVQYIKEAVKNKITLFGGKGRAK